MRSSTTGTRCLREMSVLLPWSYSPLIVSPTADQRTGMRLARVDNLKMARSPSYGVALHRDVPRLSARLFLLGVKPRGNAGGDLRSCAPLHGAAQLVAQHRDVLAQAVER